MRRGSLISKAAIGLVVISFVICSLNTTPLFADNETDIPEINQDIQPLEESNEPEFAPDQIIVKLKEGKTLDDVQELNIKYNVNYTEEVFPKVSTPQDTLKQLKDKLADLSADHQSWYWQLDKNSKEYKDYLAKIENEKQNLQEQIEAQEELIAHLEQRQKRAPQDAVTPDLGNTYLLKTSTEVDVLTMAQDYANNPVVEYAEPNYKVKASAFPQTAPNDTYVDPDQNGSWSTGAWSQSYPDMWGLRKTNTHIAWSIAQGMGTIVAVVDSGVDYNHEDIAANIWKNTGEIGTDTSGRDKRTNGVDDDSNGRVDDWRGYDFTTCAMFDSYGYCAQPKPVDNNPMDDHGHGTHVAGTIAAVGDNAKGIIGVAPKAKVMAVKGLNKQGAGYNADLVKALRYAANMGADVINNSWGGWGYSQTIADAVNFAYSRGCVIIAAAGNNKTKISTYPASQYFVTPASLSNVIAVSSTNTGDTKSDFSNYGLKIDVVAPGGNNTNKYDTRYTYENILSLRANNTDMYTGGTNIVGTKYYRARGTSMACPHVSGLAALILSRRPAFTNVKVRDVLRSSAVDLGTVGRDEVYGYGKINSYRALQIE